LFTDGVSEAMSRDSEEYGEPRLELFLLDNPTLTAQELIDAVHNDVQRHARGATQSDDITMMVLAVSSSNAGLPS
jgi:sigma-B regulation protein RsbU (phosphoserine phosphatase)